MTGTRPGGAGPAGSEYCAADFADTNSLSAFAAFAGEHTFDILINNVGINKIGPFHAIDPADFDRIQQVNVRAPFLLCQAVLPSMKSKKWGRIVNVSSIFGVVSKEFRASYSTSKFALDGMTAALAAEVAADGVLANCVSPGFVETDLTRSILGEAGIADIIARIPIRRLAQPNEIASLVAWLVSRDNTYLTGQNLLIDGGFTRV